MQKVNINIGHGRITTKESYYYSGITKSLMVLICKSRAYHDKFENTSIRTLKKILQYSHYDDYSTGAALQLSIDTRENDLLSLLLTGKMTFTVLRKRKNGDWMRYKDRT